MKNRTVLRCINGRSAESGFTLIELVIVMGIFIVVIMISAGAFEKIATLSTQQIKISDSNIQGILGLEIMRSDLGHAGFGLPYTLDFVADFNEINSGTVPANSLAKGIDPASFNDTNNTVSGDSNKVPRAIQSAAATGSTAAAYELGRDYLSIKSTYAGLNPASKKWSYIEGSGSASNIKLWGKDDLVENDQVIVLDARTRALIGADMTHFYFSVPALSGGKYTPPSAYQPLHDYDNYLVYGIKQYSAGSPNVAFPYNRVDYYIKRPTLASDLSTRCAPNTGLLYKAVLDQLGGVKEYPLLDCVADMQVIYSLDTNEDGGVDLHGNEDVLSALTAEQIRKQLKEVRVYILTHDGQKDKNYTYPTSTIHVGEFGLGRDYDLTALSPTEWSKFRWKVYSLVVVPKNINY